MESFTRTCMATSSLTRFGDLSIWDMRIYVSNTYYSCSTDLLINSLWINFKYVICIAVLANSIRLCMISIIVLFH